MWGGTNRREVEFLDVEGLSHIVDGVIGSGHFGMNNLSYPRRTHLKVGDAIDRCIIILILTMAFNIQCPRPQPMHHY